MRTTKKTIKSTGSNAANPQNNHPGMSNMAESFLMEDMTSGMSAPRTVDTTPEAKEFFTRYMVEPQVVHIKILR